LNSFLGVAIDFVRTRAYATLGTQDYEVLDLAAHLFAIASQLFLNEGSPRLTLDRPPAAADTLDELLKRLATLPADLSAQGFYWTLINALALIENELCGRQSDALALPGSTSLQDLAAEGFRGIGGEVHHWIRPASALTKLRDHRFEQAENPPQDPQPHPGTYLSRLAMYWDSQREAPAGRAQVHRFVPLVDQSGRDATHHGSFRIALCPITYDTHPQFEIDPRGELFYAWEPDGMRNPDILYEHLRDLVRAAREQEVHLLVLPELTVHSDARDVLTSLLRERGSLLPYGVIAGSFHVWRGGAGDGTKRIRVNESLLLDHSGRPLLSHWKKGQFRVLDRHVDALPAFFPSRPAKLKRKIREDITWGSRLEVLETSLGRLAVLICADAIDVDTHHHFLPVVKSLRPDLLFVIAMSPETGPFERTLQDLSACRIGTAFVNANCICQPTSGRRGPRRPAGETEDGFEPDPDSGPLLSFLDLALYEPRDAPATRVAWRKAEGGGGPKRYSFHRHGWLPFPPREGSEVFWLTRSETPDGPPLGLGFDLGHHWRFSPAQE
jgi:predicted amidohydrolase